MNMKTHRLLIIITLTMMLTAGGAIIVKGDTASGIPDPMILVHGGFEDGYFDFLLNEEGKKPVPNTVVLRTKYGGLSSQIKDAAKKLKEKGVLLVRHVTRTPNVISNKWQNAGCTAADGPNYQAKIPKCAYINAQNWKDKMNDDLDGALPGGFKAIAIDEIPLMSNFPDHPDLTFDVKIAVETLKVVKTDPAFKDFFKDKFVFVWAGGDPEADVLETMLTYADRILVEQYLNEGDALKSLGNVTNQMIQICETKVKKPICDDIVRKSIITIATTETEDGAKDNNPGIDFLEYLDEELHYIKNDPVLSKLPGIAFYPFNRTRGETITWINKLARHYYIDDQPGYYSSDDFKLGYIKDPSFEEGGSAWTIQTGIGGEISTKDITTIDPKLIDDDTYLRRIPHGHKVVDKTQNKLVYNVLYMKRGSTQNTATQGAALPKGVYHLDVYAKKFSPPYEEAHGDVQVVGPNGSSLITYKEKRKINIQDVFVDAADPKYYLWTRFRIEFKVPEGNFPVKVILSDNQADIGEITLWDFVELEKLKSGSLTAGIVSFNVKLPAESLNLIGNSGFEDGLNNWWTWVADGTSITVSDTAYEGKSGVNILTSGGSSRGAVFKTGPQAIPVTPGERYTFSAWVKTENVGFAQLQVRFFTSAYGWLGDVNDPTKGEMIPPNQDWKKYDLTFIVPEKAIYMTPMLYAQGGKGYAYFDSTSLVKATNIISLLKNRSFEDGVNFWREESNGDISLKGEVNKLEGGLSQALLLQTNAGYNSFEQDLFLQQTFNYKISGWVYLDNFKEGDAASIRIRAYTNSDACKDFIVPADNSKQKQWQSVEAVAKIDWAYRNNAELLLSVYRAPSDGGAVPPLAAYFDDINVEFLSNNYAGAVIQPVDCLSEEPVAPEPIVQEPVVKESAVQEPVVQETVVTGPAVPEVKEQIVPEFKEPPASKPPEAPAISEETPAEGGGGGGGCSLIP